MDRCITIFQEKFTDILETKDFIKIRSYVDFVNSQLFYFQKKYITKDVAYEWIDGMIDAIPIQDKSGTIVNPRNSIPQIVKEGILNQYQRVKRAFTVRGSYNYELIYSPYENEAKSLKRMEERSRLVKEVYGNLMRC